MKKEAGSFRLQAFGFLVMFTPILCAQTITGVSNERQYNGQVTFTVLEEAGFDTTATLNGDPVPVGIPYRVARMDFYELVALRTPNNGGITTSKSVHFIIISENRASAERGLIEWTPYPLTPSTSAEFAGGRLDLIIPQDFPQGLEIPVVAWVRDSEGNEIRGNGTITAAGFDESPIRVLRGVGSGFLPAASGGGALSYDARLHDMASDKIVSIDTNTTWTPMSGTLAGANTWPANSRIHLDANVTIPAGSSLTIQAGSIIKVDPLVNIINSGAVIINGTLTRPVVMTATHHVSPEVHTHAWGGFVMRGDDASLVASGAILVGGGGATQWSFSPGKSHRSEQAVLLVHNGAMATLTDSAILNTAGQVGNGYNADVTLERTLVQRAITAGEYVGGVITLDHAALIEFPEDNGEVNADIADADYDAIYFTTGTHILRDSLIGFCKDDAIDSGSGGSGTVVMHHCWLESSLHEAMAWSGGGRVTETFDTVVMNNGQGFECGYSSGSNSPLCYGENMLLTGNAVGARFGDNYDWTYNGQMTVTQSLILNNYRDVWGYNWDDWTYRSVQMDIYDNWVTQPNIHHPNNIVWDPEIDAARLVPFMGTAPDANVGVGMATWDNQTSMGRLEEGVPVRLSTFTPHRVSVDYQIQESSATVLKSGTLFFEPGETLKTIPMASIDPNGQDLFKVSLREPNHAELTGVTSHYFVQKATTEKPLVPRQSVWKYHNRGQDLGTAWRDPLYDDSAWPAGPGDLGNGDGGEATVIDIGPSSSRFSTVYFRTRFTVAEPNEFATLEFALRRDDGAVVYLNGKEVFRHNMPAGDVTYRSFSKGNAGSETTYYTGTYEASVLVPGINLIAVEVHQDDDRSSDLHFDLGLVGSLGLPAQILLGL
ncbi:MAG: hypothetical protein HQ515_26470 [Phycisphaeraceae bacterium]|nr:hypothetical protein [Phycisphaeraceae bacterium]